MRQRSGRARVRRIRLRARETGPLEGKESSLGPHSLRRSLMLTRIVQPSAALETYLESLHLGLSRPQAEHLLDLVDGLLVSEERKTLAALQRQFLDSTDPSNWADFLRISPWSVAETRDALRRHQAM